MKTGALLVLFSWKSFSKKGPKFSKPSTVFHSGIGKLMIAFPADANRALPVLRQNPRGGVRFGEPPPPALSGGLALETRQIFFHLPPLERKD